MVASDLAAPWSVAFLPDGSALVTQRDEATVVQVDSDSPTPRKVGAVPGVDDTGEGGLMGMAVSPAAPDQVYLYWSTAEDNRIGVADWNGESLSEPRVIFSGIPHAAIHDGGRILFGPDGMLYVGTGDAGEGSLAQDAASLGGKILRLTPTGTVPADNPLPSSPVYSLGHRNVQGLAFDPQGRLWASEFGAGDVDELNLIRPGGNYGWPMFEGPADEPGYSDPAASWSPTSIASPSGMAISAGSAWVAALRGESLWQVPLNGEVAGEPVRHLAGDLGRLRDVVVAPDGSLWVVTNNTDGRGSPAADDDRILRVSLP
ncbi:MAG: PQQ-dependent sugar dehydrogenase [Actinobacteria bacterium]|nr:PQQ-dependent sugar dehydrogenase [Actinomycetota bacterium]MCB9413286.1 PQQ-dependent sugar dehydrogenase [Actinomycetota bacterium]